MINAQGKSIALALCVIFVGLIFSFFVNPLLVWAGILALIVGGGLFGRPEKMLMAYICWALVSQLIQLVLPGPFSYIDELLIVGCIAVLIGQRALLRRRLLSYKLFVALFVALVTTGVASSLISKGPLVSLINGLVTYFTFPFLMYLAYECRSEKSMRLFVLIFIVFLCIQVVLNMGWIAGVNPLPNLHAMQRNYRDMCHGTLNSAQWLGYVMIWLVFLFISLGRHLPSGGWKRAGYFFAFVAGIQFMFTYTNHAYLYLAGCAGCYLLIIARNRRQLFKYVMLLSIFAVVAFSAGQLASSKIYSYEEHDDFGQIFSVRNLQNRYDKFVYAPKMQLIRKVTVDWRKTSPEEWFVGMGIGNGTSAIGMTRVSPGAYELLAEYYLTATGQQERYGNSIMESTHSGLVTLWSEVGVVGFLLYQALSLMVLFRIWKNLKHKVYHNVYQLILAEAFVPAMVLYIISSFLTDAYFLDAWLLIWIWAGFVLSPIDVPDGLEEDVVNDVPESSLTVGQ